MKILVCIIVKGMFVCLFVFQPNYHHQMSPGSHTDLLASGLPPMSSFRGGQVPSSYPDTPPTVNGSEIPVGQGQQPPPPPPTTSQTGDALGKALASVSIVYVHLVLVKFRANRNLCFNLET